jgi:hypothetical protein
MIAAPLAATAFPPRVIRGLGAVSIGRFIGYGLMGKASPHSGSSKMFDDRARRSIGDDSPKGSRRWGMARTAIPTFANCSTTSSRNVVIATQHGTRS